MMARLQQIPGADRIPGLRMIPTPASLLRRAGVGLRSGLTLASLAHDLEVIHGDAHALTEEFPDGTTRALTHRDIAELVGRYSASIAARSQPGEPVVVATPNGIDQLIVSLAASRVGRLPAPVNSQMSAAEIRHVVSDCGASLVVRNVGELERGKGSASEVPPAVTPDPAAVAALFYTSGTTGKPKGAELTHRGLVGQMSAAALVPPVLGGHEVLMGLPVAHIMGFIAVLGPLVSGVPVYFLDRFAPTRALEVIEERRVAAFMGVPAMYRMMLEAGAADRDLSSVRLWISGADVMPAELARRFKSFGAIATLPFVGAIGEASFVEGYGMVEVAGGVAAKISPPMLPLGLGDSLGLRLPGWHFRVIDEEGEPVRNGEEGELQVKGPGVLEGYWGDDANTASVMTHDGWLRTGDLVRNGPFGTVVFAGRVKNVVLSGGYTVYPTEVEGDLEEHRDVVEAAVLGVPDARFGESVVAAVRLRPGAKLTEEDLLRWASQRMARYKAPRHIVFVEEMPRTGTRKVQRDKLVELFQTG